MNEKILPKLISSILGIGSAANVTRALINGKIEMFRGDPRIGESMLHEATMSNSDAAFYILLVPLLLFSLALFITCAYDIWRKEIDFKKWQAVPLFGMLGMWGVLVVYMLIV